VTPNILDSVFATVSHAPMAVGGIGLHGALARLLSVAIAAADPFEATAAALARHVRTDRLRLTRPACVRLLAAGKGAVAMAAAAAAALPATMLDAANSIVVTKRGQGGGAHGDSVRAAGLTILEAGHPVPDAEGAVAAARVSALAQGVQRDQSVLVLLSGGASALLPLPAPGMTLEDLQVSSSQSPAHR